MLNQNTVETRSGVWSSRWISAEVDAEIGGGIEQRVERDRGRRDAEILGGHEQRDDDHLRHQIGDRDHGLRRRRPRDTAVDLRARAAVRRPRPLADTMRTSC